VSPTRTSGCSASPAEPTERAAFPAGKTALLS
jgi:hypothetical protein